MNCYRGGRGEPTQGIPLTTTQSGCETLAQVFLSQVEGDTGVKRQTARAAKEAGKHGSSCSSHPCLRELKFPILLKVVQIYFTQPVTKRVSNLIFKMKQVWLTQDHKQPAYL